MLSDEWMMDYASDSCPVVSFSAWFGRECCCVHGQVSLKKISVLVLCFFLSESANTISKWISGISSVWGWIVCNLRQIWENLERTVLLCNQMIDFYCLYVLCMNSFVHSVSSSWARFVGVEEVGYRTTALGSITEGNWSSWSCVGSY